MLKNLIIYSNGNFGKDEVFITEDGTCAEEVVSEFYKYCGGRISCELFDKISKNSDLSDLVELFECSATGTKIKHIFVNCEEELWSN